VDISKFGIPKLIDKVKKIEYKIESNARAYYDSIPNTVSKILYNNLSVVEQYGDKQGMNLCILEAKSELNTPSLGI